MATFKEFCDGVLREMPRATAGEKADIREELTDHLLEHRDMLLDHGMEQEEAERRAVEAMGDAEAIGKAWNDKLSPFWLWCGRVCKVLLVLLALALILPAYSWAERLGDNLYARYSGEPKGYDTVEDAYAVRSTDHCDIREQFGEHIIRIYRTRLAGRNGEAFLHVDLVTYPENPFHDPLYYDVLMHHLRCDGQPSLVGEGGGQYWSAAFPVSREAERVSITLDYLGQHFETEIALDWKGESP